MYSSFQVALKYIRYRLTASNGKGHGVHSPFVFSFITDVLNDKHAYGEYADIEKLRRQLLDDREILDVQDLGAGSVKGSSIRRTVSSIARNAAKPRKYSQLLFRIARHFQPDAILELGTSLGITTAYLAKARPAAGIISMEGATAIAQRARKNFLELGIRNITLAEGNFDDQLPVVLEGMTRADLVFIDGNHRAEPTQRYFSQILARTNEESIVILDDIHWSREMETAWEAIKAHPEVRCTIDLFFIGIVLFRKEFLEKQHFTIRF